MFDFYAENDIPCFGVAGNFTGHLEQAGEAADFINVKTRTADAPKAVFPTYIPQGAGKESSSVYVPDFLHVFPFSPSKIIFPHGEEKLQIEPECAIVFESSWQGNELTGLKPLYFGASNDCSIRKAGARKISEKKNWGKCSKGFASTLIPAEGGFEKPASYRIASFLFRDGVLYDYGEDSLVRDYSYFGDTLTQWLLEKFNSQKDEGPAEDIHSYILKSGVPSRIMVSVGATRYTPWGEQNFLQGGDRSAVILYPDLSYTHERISELTARALADEEEHVLSRLSGISALVQTVQI